jgi:hypothetical protein
MPKIALVAELKPVSNLAFSVRDSGCPNSSTTSVLISVTLGASGSSRLRVG